MRTSILIKVSLAIGTLSPMARGDVIFVDSSIADPGNGSSWNLAFNDLQDAIAAAKSGDEIWVRAGVYTPAGPGGDRTASFHLAPGVAWYGGFDGTEEQREDRSWDTNITTLSGDLNGDDATGVGTDENSEHVVNASNADLTSILDGFEIRAGHATIYGGGVFCANGAAVIRNCVFRKNSAGSRGGGVGIVAGEVLMISCILTDNVADIGGGIGMHEEASLTMRDCRVMQNSAIAGGGLSIQSGGSLTAVRCTFQNNEATISCGGGVYLGGSSSNSNLDSDWTFVNCAILDNTAGFCGGGMTSVQGELTMINCVVAGNNANRGGGIHTAKAVTEIINCTVSRNDSAGIMIGVGSDAAVTISNSIVWLNTGGGIVRDNGGSIANVHSVNSNMQQTMAGSGNISADPQFAQPSTHNYGLLAGSPSLNAGLNAHLPPDVHDADADGDTTETLPIDLAGADRVQDAAVDQGAYEGSYEAGPRMDQTDFIWPGESAALIPSGELPLPWEVAFGVVTNLMSSYAVSATLTEEDTPSGQGMQKLMTSSTTMPDGEFLMRLHIPFEFDDESEDPLAFDLMRFNEHAGRWEHAVSANTVNSPGHDGPVGDRIVTVAPDPIQFSDQVGDYGIFMNPATGKGFHWANVDRADRFSTGKIVCREDGDQPRGVVDIADLWVVLTAWGECNAPCVAMCEGDVNGDCVVDVRDLLQVLSAWGACDEP